MEERSIASKQTTILMKTSMTCLVISAMEVKMVMVAKKKRIRYRMDK
jgi:hypothetical protein